MGIRLLPWTVAAARKLLSTTSVEAAEASSAEASSAAITTKFGGRKDGRPLYRRLSALGVAPEGSVAKTMNKWLREGRAVRVEELIKYVKELRKYQRYRHALELMDWMVKTRGVNLSYTNCAICLDLIGKVRGVKSAEEYFNGLPEPAKNERTYGALLNCYCSAKMDNKATALYDKMKDLNISSNTLVHNNLMSLHLKLKQPEKVRSVFRAMKTHNIALDNLSYCMVMNSYASQNDIEAVDGVIREMEEEGKLVIQWTAYSTLAAIYNSAGLFEKAESALKKLEGLIDGSSREPFHFLISLYAGARNLEEVKRVWKSLKATFPKQTNLSYFIMLHALNKLDDFESMKECFDEWVSVQEVYDLRIANLMLGAYLQKDMEREAKAILEEADEKGLKADLRTCNLFMDYYLKKCKIAAAMEWLKVLALEIKDRTWKLDRERMETFFMHFEKEKEVAGAEKFCKILKELGCINSKAYESLIRVYFVAGKKQPSLQRRILDDKIKLDPEMHEMLETVSK
ncbi:Pentatricopeptide repeat-containing protein [Apostasia shenzhenica]|uniref:Pentatricopeptide repeat-containing protein n=1 Tax=Apostasia shenzhenica TaxID=1088818 RepID=A0A2I0AJX9_9ASPA|nr:Pentatricopeptide repeat-containing protein [Apostasia shenzhenica]